MDLEAYREKLAKAGPHPGLSDWHKKTVLLYRCRDISDKDFRGRFLAMSDKLESLLEQALPENLEPETYELSANYYIAAAKCLDSYLEGIDEVLHWSDTGQESALDASRKCFNRGDKEWNETLFEALEMERQFQEIEEALFRSLAGDLAGY
jgi:hypothetical protein